MKREYRAKILFIAVLLLVFILPENAAAQETLFDPETTVIPNPLTMLLRNQIVAGELALSLEQSKEIDQVLSPAELSLWQMRDMTSAQRQGRDTKILGQLHRQLSTILSARQYGRLEELLFQAKDLRVFLDPEIVRRLGLSDVQKDQIRTTLIDLNDRIRTIESDADGDNPDRPQLIQHQQINAMNRIIQTLNDAQKRQVATFGGRAFDFSHIRQKACRAPEFEQVTAWPNSKPLKLSDLRGRVVVIHFYALSCANCKRNLPHYNAWQKQFSSDPFTMIGIHRPELEHERDVNVVRQNAQEQKMTYPIAVDNDSANWNAWANRVWPTVYLVDKDGFVRYWWYGELNWQDAKGEQWMRQRIEALLKE